MPLVPQDDVQDYGGNQGRGGNGDEAGGSRPLERVCKLSRKKRAREKAANTAAAKAGAGAASNGTTAKERRTLETKPKWPRIIDAPVRDVMPGSIPVGPSRSIDGLEAQRDDWEAPWIVGLVDRVEDGKKKDHNSEGGVFHNRGDEKERLNVIANTATGDGEVENVDLVDWTSGETVLSDLHHEIVRFSEYVSLTPAERKARERVVSCVTEAAVEAFGPGATVEAFGSYEDIQHGGSDTDAPDVNVRPGYEGLGAAKNHGGSSLGGSRLTVDGMNFRGGPGNGYAFEEGSTSSSSNSAVSGETGIDGIDVLGMDTLGEAEASKGTIEGLGEESEQKRSKSSDDHLSSSAVDTADADRPATNGFSPENKSSASLEMFEIVIDCSPDPAVQKMMALEKEKEEEDMKIATSGVGIKEGPESTDFEEEGEIVNAGVPIAAALKLGGDKEVEKGEKGKRGDTHDYATAGTVTLRDSGSSESLRAVYNSSKGGWAFLKESSGASAGEKCEVRMEDTGRLASQQLETDAGLVAKGGNTGSVTLPLPNGLEFNMRSEAFSSRNQGVGSIAPAATAGTPGRDGTSLEEKQSAVAGLMKFSKRLREKAWVEAYEIRSHAKVPIVVWRDARNGVECDVAWGGDGQANVIRTQPGPFFFADMFPGIFKPLAQFLKVFMRQRGIDKPNKGGVGSFKLYALIAAFLKTCGISSKLGAAADLGDLLLGFLRHYSRKSPRSLTRNTVLYIKNLRVDLSSAKRALTVSKIFREAYNLLSTPISDSSNPRSSSSRGERSAAALKAGGRRFSLLRCVIWGGDLRRERETRLAAAKSKKMSPYPGGAEPAWHIELRARSETGAALGTGKLLKRRIKLHPRLLEKLSTMREKRLAASTRESTFPASDAQGVKSKRRKKKKARLMETSCQGLGSPSRASGAAGENGQHNTPSAPGSSGSVALGGNTRRKKRKARLMETSGQGLGSPSRASGATGENGQHNTPSAPGSSGSVALGGNTRRKKRKARLMETSGQGLGSPSRASGATGENGQHNAPSAPGSSGSVAQEGNKKKSAIGRNGRQSGRDLPSKGMGRLVRGREDRPR